MGLHQTKKATGEEGGERGRGVAVRVAFCGAGIGGVGGAKGLAESASKGLVIMFFGSPLIETKRVLL